MIKSQPSSEWVDIERSAPPRPILPIATVVLSRRKSGAVFASVSLRREAAKWAFENARFRVQISAKDSRHVRLIPDKKGGNFTVGNFKGVARISLGAIDQWPHKEVDPVEATLAWQDVGAMLTMPESFGDARHNPATNAKANKGMNHHSRS